MRLHPQAVIQGRHLRDVAPLGTPSDPAAPLERAKQAGDLALGKALTPQRGPTGRAGGPGGRPTGAFGQHSFDKVDGEDTGQLPHRQDQLR